MKLLLIFAADDNCNIISRSVSPLGFEMIRYRQVLKAMDNIDEIDPSAIVVSAKDFPRHWKFLVQFVRTIRANEICPIIIMKGGNFSMEEMTSAYFLGVSGVIDDSLNSPAEINRLKNILSHYAPLEEKRKHRRFHVEPWNRACILAVNRRERSLVTGDIENISSGGMAFVPINSPPITNAVLNDQFGECSLRLGDSILSPVCRLVRAGEKPALEFVSFPEGEQRLFERFIQQIAGTSP
jgi:methylmalonyl-CoA mutase cobalamin-binding subunit